MEIISFIQQLLIIELFSINYNKPRQRGKYDSIKNPLGCLRFPKVATQTKILNTLAGRPGEWFPETIRIGTWWCAK